MEIEVVRAKLKDAAKIEELDRLGSFQPRIIEKYLSPIDQTEIRKYSIFLAKIGEKAVGKVEMAVGMRSEGPIAYIRRLVVHPDYRGRGIAALLMKRAMVRARRERVKSVELHAVENDIPAMRLYEKLGFKVKHREIHYRKKMR